MPKYERYDRVLVEDPRTGECLSGEITLVWDPVYDRDQFYEVWLDGQDPGDMPHQIPEGYILRKEAKN